MNKAKIEHKYSKCIPSTDGCRRHCARCGSIMFMTNDFLKDGHEVIHETDKNCISFFGYIKRLFLKSF